MVIIARFVVHISTAVHQINLNSGCKSNNLCKCLPTFRTNAQLTICRKINKLTNSIYLWAKMNAIRGLMELLYERWILLKSKTTTKKCKRTKNANKMEKKACKLKWKIHLLIQRSLLISSIKQLIHKLHSCWLQFSALNLCGALLSVCWIAAIALTFALNVGS